MCRVHFYCWAHKKYIIILLCYTQVYHQYAIMNVFRLVEIFDNTLVNPNENVLS